MEFEVEDTNFFSYNYEERKKREMVTGREK